MQSIPYQRLTTLQIQSKIDWVSDEIVVNSDINKYVQYKNGKTEIIDGQINEVIVSTNYILNDIDNFIVIGNISSDVTITVPNLVADLIGKEWRIIRNDNSNFKIFISLENPTNSLFTEQFHTLSLNGKGDGVLVRSLNNKKYSYAEFSGRLLVASIPIIITTGADLSGTSLLMFATVQKLAHNLQIDVNFRYREEGTSAWSYTTSIIVTSVQKINQIANVTAGVKYEVQAILTDSKSIKFYGELVISSTWIDLRAGGEILSAGDATGNDIRFRSGMSIVRDEEGLSFTGASPWSSWVKFEKYKWNRGDEKTIQWIFTRPSTSMMIGIGSDATNETSSSQYGQAEIEAYFRNPETLSGLYGNNGIVGDARSQGVEANISGGPAVFKIKFTKDGEGGIGVFSLYELPSANKSDWSDESNLIVSRAIKSNMVADELILMPFIIPTNGGTQRFIALKINN